MPIIEENRSFDAERALYGLEGLKVTNCRFDGPADGESAMKECRDVVCEDSFFNLRYPFWHDTNLRIERCELTEKCRAALWYSEHVDICGSLLHGIKALRECSDVRVSDCDIVSPEFGWSSCEVSITDSSAESEYFMLRAERLTFSNVRLKGKYSFQYITDSSFENCEFDTKDSFWHAKNVTVRNSKLKGEYLGWYSEGLTLINCTITGTQPLCYCKDLKLIDCTMIDTDLSFEKSEVEATLTAPIISIKNPACGTISVPACGELIMDDPKARGRVVLTGESGKCA